MGLSGRSVFWVWFQVSSGKFLVLRAIYPFPLALPLDQNENWDSPYSHVNAQN